MVGKGLRETEPSFRDISMDDNALKPLSVPLTTHMALIPLSAPSSLLAGLLNRLCYSEHLGPMG